MRLPAEAARALTQHTWQSLADQIPQHTQKHVTYSRKVFIPLTRLCQDSCGYCTFAHHNGLPSNQRAYLTPEEILNIARRGADAGCTEALFTLGDRPEARWPAAREELAMMGFESTVDYLAEVASHVLDETGLLPHTNPGLLRAHEMAKLKAVAVSQGVMIESLAENVKAHKGCATKLPHLRLRQLELAGRLSVPFTTGLLLGLGETRADTIEALLRIRHSHERFGGHVQELIVQPFRPKEGTRMAESEAFPEDELLWAVAASKLILGPSGIPIQSPPNLSSDPAALRRLLRCGVTDWGGVSPGVTADHVNPEAAWPEVALLRAHTEAAGRVLVPRLPAYPKYVADRALQTRSLRRWQHPALHAHVRKLSDADGHARGERSVGTSWYSGLLRPPPSGVEEPEHTWLPFGDEFEQMRRTVALGHEAEREIAGLEEEADADRDTKGATTLLLPLHGHPHIHPDVIAALEAALNGGGLALGMIERLLRSRGPELAAMCVAADLMRQRLVGSGVSYAVCRNINYTNRCSYACTFCAFSKGTMAAKGAAYDVDHAEVSRRVREAWARGATEVCMQGGIDPRYDGASYVGFLRAAKAGEPRIHVHAFSPLEVAQGAAADGISTAQYLATLKREQLGSLPGTSAEILSDPVRDEICPDKLRAREWVSVVGEAHAAGLPTTATIMFGHTEGHASVAKHLMRLRVLQERSLRASHGARITEFVPLPFVHPEAPVFRRGAARAGPTLREAVLMHAVARLALPNIRSVQTSWTKMGAKGAAMALRAGANDLGGTLMSESISRAAGASHGQEMMPSAMRTIVDSLPPDGVSYLGEDQDAPAVTNRRHAWQRTTLYDEADEERSAAADAAGPLQPVAIG